MPSFWALEQLAIHMVTRSLFPFDLEGCGAQDWVSGSPAGQPLYKGGRVWCHAYMQVVSVLMQHSWIRYKDLAPDWPVCALGIVATS